MYKLLPPEEKKKVEAEYKLRRLIVFLFSLLFVTLVLVVGLFPAYVTTTSRKAALEERLNTLVNSPSQDESSALKTWAEEVRHKLSLLSPANDTDKPYELFVSIVAIKPKGIKLNGLSYGREKSKLVVSVAGIAMDRQSLLAFEKALNDSKKFVAESFPISDLAKDSDIPFEFDLNPLL